MFLDSLYFHFWWQALNYFVFLYPLYMSFTWTIGGLVFYFRRERKTLPQLDSYPPFTILIPARNEEKHIEDVIKNLEHLDYPAYEVIAINDGSTDRTPEILEKLLSRYASWLRVINIHPSSGKANALNMGILSAKHEFILSIDADCFVNNDVLKWMAWHLDKFPRVGAVTGNPRIINRTSLLGKIQVGEYSSIIGLIKRTQRNLGKLLTVSGVIAAYRKFALLECGLFDSDTVTEDINITWKLQKKFWDIRYEPKAVCWMLVPETIRGLWKQRVRWTQGGIEVIKKHVNIWTDIKQKRLWPVYVEYVTTILWAFALGFLVTSWIIMFCMFHMGMIGMQALHPLIPPAWTGSVLALVCLCQFGASLYIDSHYENKSLVKYYFWVIWYPIFYWLINALTVFAGMYNVFIKKGGVSTQWQSPDRGLHTIK